MFDNFFDGTLPLTWVVKNNNHKGYYLFMAHDNLFSCDIDTQKIPYTRTPSISRNIILMGNRFELIDKNSSIVSDE